MSEANRQAFDDLWQLATAGRPLTGGELYGLPPDDPLHGQVIGNAVSRQSGDMLLAVPGLGRPVGQAAVGAVVVDSLQHQTFGQEPFLAVRTCLEWNWHLEGLAATRHRVTAYYELTAEHACALDTASAGAPMPAGMYARWTYHPPAYTAETQQEVAAERAQWQEESPLDEAIIGELNNHKQRVVRAAQRVYPELAMLAHGGDKRVRPTELPAVAEYLGRAASALAGD